VNILRKNLPIAIAFFMGLIGILTYYSSLKSAADLVTNLSSWDRIIAGFALVVGIYSLLNHHYHKVRSKAPGWGFSIVVYTAMIVMVIAGFSFKMDVPEKEEFGTWSVAKQHMLLWMNGVTPYKTPEAFNAAKYNTDGTERVDKDGNPIRIYLDTPKGRLDGQEHMKRVPMTWLYDSLFVPMSATMFSLLAFYIASAAYRAFRARSIEATVLLATAIILMIGRVPLGEAIWKGFPGLTEWILSNPSMAAQRGIMIGIGLGMIATSLRIIFGIERTYMGGGD
jgi:hypothetical protein